MSRRRNPPNEKVCGGRRQAFPSDGIPDFVAAAGKDFV
jgi:hypothetical protein